VSNGLVRYAVATAGLIMVVGALLSALFRGPGDAVAIVVSGVVAMVVQLAAFSIGRALSHNLSARMGATSILRLLVLVAYALLVAKVLQLPLVAALVSLAAFFFLSTLIEPLLIKS